MPPSPEENTGKNGEIVLELDAVIDNSSDGKSKEQSKLAQLRDFFKLTKDGSSPVRWSIIFIIFVALFGSAFVITFLFPFLPHMVVSLGYSEEDKGYYAGLVASSFFLGRVFGSYFWGWLSDRKGRKPVILINLALTVIATFGFGFTRTLWFAIIMRFITGAMNGVISTAKSVLYEISDDSTQAITMSSISLAWGMGIILGPTVGGFLANPVERYPDFFPPEGFFKDYPFFLPCMVACLICFFAFIVVLLKLPETHKKIIGQRKEREKKIQEAAVRKEEMMGLLHGQKPHGDKGPKAVTSLPVNTQIAPINIGAKLSAQDRVKRIRTSSCSADMGANSRALKGNTPVARLPGVKSLGSLPRCHSDPLMRMFSADDVATVTKGQTSQQSSLCSNDSASLLKLLRMPDVQKSVGIYTLLSFAVVGYDQIFAVWSSTDTYYDGLGFTPVQIGLAIGAVSVPLLVLQLFIFPKLEAKLGAKRTNHWCCFILMILITATPVMSSLAEKPVPLWIMLIVVLAPNRIATICCFTSMALFINNSVPPEHAGAVNGLSVTFAAIARAMAPLISGSIYAWSIVQNYGYPIDVNLMFIIFGLVYMAAVLLNLLIPERLNKQRKKKKRVPVIEQKPEIETIGTEQRIPSRHTALETHRGLSGIEIVFPEDESSREETSVSNKTSI